VAPTPVATVQPAQAQLHHPAAHQGREDPAGARVRNGKRVQLVRGARLRAPVNLRGLPKGRVTVAVEVTTASGKRLRGTRKYRASTPKRRTRSGPPPL